MGYTPRAYEQRGTIKPPQGGTAVCNVQRDNSDEMAQFIHGVRRVMHTRGMGHAETKTYCVCSYCLRVGEYGTSCAGCGAQVR